MPTYDKEIQVTKTGKQKQMSVIRYFLAAATMAAVAGAAWAQDTASTAEETAESATESAALQDVANNSAFGDWIVTCEAVTVQRTACRLVQELTERESGGLVARFIAVPVTDGAILLAQVPMGAYLPGGAVYRFDGNDDIEQREMIWQRCLGNICEAATPIDAEEMELFAKSDAILFGYKLDAASEPIIVRVDISQFAEAIKRIAPPT